MNQNPNQKPGQQQQGGQQQGGQQPGQKGPESYRDKDKDQQKKQA